MLMPRFYGLQAVILIAIPYAALTSTDWLFIITGP